jgi:hypothetical protein
LGLRPTGNFMQFNASSTFSLIRFESSGPAIWFKATGEPNQKELAITLVIARLLSPYVPLILGVHPVWNGWLSGELPGSQLDQIADSTEWERTADTLAQMQIASIAGTSILLEAGCKDLRIPNLIRKIDPFLQRMIELMKIQEKVSPSPLDPERLEILGRRLRQSCEELQGIGLPDTVTHIDFNPGNILLSPERCSFLDWAEGSVSNPAITFEYLREHFNRRRIGNGGGPQKLETTYVRAWSSSSPPNAIAAALKYSPLVAAFAYAVRDLDWNTETTHKHPRVAGYYRALTRRMYVEAMRITEAEIQCHNG